METQPYRILIIAGEASGDVHGGGLVKEFHARYPEVDFEGVGGRHMREAGVKLVQDIARLGAMGISEFFGSFLHHIQLLRTLTRKINSGYYHAAILINYPGFNLRLARVLKKADCPVLFLSVRKSGPPARNAWRQFRRPCVKCTWCFLSNNLFMKRPEWMSRIWGIPL